MFSFQILVIDIFFYDKEIEDFNTLCRTVLVSFKEYLVKNRRKNQVDLTFQLTSVFMLCLLKLKLNKSPKVHSLVAFLVAFCSEIVEITIAKVDDFVADHKDENLKFSDVYNRKFNDFDKKIKTAREVNRSVAKKQQIDKPKYSGSDRNGSVNNSQKTGHSSNHLSLESKPTSDEASGKSDAAPIIFKKPAQPPPKRRRKRCKASGSMSSSDESETESIASGSDGESMNSDFDSYDENDDFSDRYSDDGSDEEGNDDDFVIENEEIVYTNGEEKKKTNGVASYSFQEEQQASSSDDFVIEDEQVIYPEDDDDEEEFKFSRLKYKKKYCKVDPNLIIRFNESNVSWMKSLRVLFDWLRLNQEVLLGCYRSNPEFISKIMKLINFLNIDIFTRKIFFERSLITTKNVRENLRYLFDIRHQIATQEDIDFKKNIMFEELQQSLDWELNYKLQITPEEELILRNFKIIDFGFYICKMKKFNFNFCARSRIFIEKAGRRRNRRQRKTSDENNGFKKGPRRRRNRGIKRMSDNNCETFERMTIQKHSQEVEEFPSLEQSNQRNFRKGYLRNKMTDKDNDYSNTTDSSIDKKNELMGKLWLKSEIQTLESKKSSVALTPYVMVDSVCLTDFLYIVKNLVKSKKFVVLIPKAGKN